MRPTFTIKRVTFRQKGVRYEAFTVRDYLHGKRIRRQFKHLEKALGGKNRLEVAAANGSLAIQTVNTRLSSEHLVEAEACFRLGDKSLAQAIGLVTRLPSAASSQVKQFQASLPYMPTAPDGKELDISEALRNLCRARR